MRARRALTRQFLLAALCLAGVVACKRTPPASTDAGPPVAPGAATVAIAPAPVGAAPVEPQAVFDPAAPKPRELPSAEAPQDPYVLEVGVDVVPGKTVAAAPTVDPFDAAVGSVRSSAVGCFAGLPPGDYAATISVFVTPAGTATTVTVTSGPSDDAVRKCLVQAATRGYPTSPDGRKLSIDVSVKG